MPTSSDAIVIEGLAKRYRIPAPNAVRHRFLADAVLHRLRHPLQRAHAQEFWALQDVSVRIGQGDVVAFMGPNGAGKSTLLKILSRITAPTKGRVRVWGRIGSLLEVGTGFHPELTGRENIYLNGAIMGMSRGEIERLFDAILDFAGVHTFIDVPLKRYSSGMQVRLAFAVAAHLQSEIMIIDEVLSVGDAAFQKKCLDKVEAMAGDGRTIILVSHHAESLRRLCGSGVLLEGGRVTHQGTVAECLARYTPVQDAVRSHWTGDGRPPLGFTEARAHWRPDSLDVVCHLATTGAHPPATVHLGINRADGLRFGHVPIEATFIDPAKARHRVVFRVSLPPLIPGAYRIHVWAGSGGEEFDKGPPDFGFTVPTSPIPGRTEPHDMQFGFIIPPHHYEYEAFDPC